MWKKLGPREWTSGSGSEGRAGVHTTLMGDESGGFSNRSFVVPQPVSFVRAVICIRVAYKSLRDEQSRKTRFE